MHKKTHLRKDKFYTFDIETTTIATGLDSNNDPILNGIIWSGQFYDGVDYYRTRSLADTIKRLKIIEDENREESPYKICVVVQNLAYEFQFIKDFFNFQQILCTDTRKIISAETDQIVFRCSYFLSNMGLEKFLQNEKVPEEYQKTEMDYLKERFPWTETTPDEDIYCANDVIGLHIAIENRISHEFNCDINNLPLTSTGYIRRECRKAVNSNKNNKYRFRKNKLDKETFLMCLAAFRGGNTHANKMYVNKELGYGTDISPEGVGSVDEASAYPAALLLYDYPQRFTNMGAFKESEFRYYLNNWQKWGMLIEVTFIDIHLKNPDATPVPYISTSKCNPLVLYYKKKTDKKGKKEKHPLQVDNGRIIRCKLMTTIITEIDWRIIESQYEWKECKITRVKAAKKKPIPKEIREIILKHYLGKTSLKQDEDDPNFDEDKFYLYNHSKRGINGIYGMHVTNPVKSEYEFNSSTHEVIEHKPDVQEALDDYYDSFSSFLDYQTGVWCTAYARMMLQNGMDLLLNKENSGKSDLVYCDTDSLKFLHPASHRADIEALNQERIKLCEKREAYIDYNGKRYYLGIFEEEGSVKGLDGHKFYKKFKTWGAKKYMYSIPDGGFKITISGVPKKKGVKCIKKDLSRGKLKSPFDVAKGYVFHNIKTTSVYMDLNGVQEIEVQGHKLQYASNIAMYPNSYTLGLTYDFEVLLDKYKDIMEG